MSRFVVVNLDQTPVYQTEHAATVAAHEFAMAQPGRRFTVLEIKGSARDGQKSG